MDKKEWWGQAASQLASAASDPATIRTQPGSAFSLSLMTKLAVGVVTVSVATYVVVSRYNGGKDLIRRLRRQNLNPTLVQRCQMTRKKIEQMWPTCPSIVQQDVSYTMHK